MLRTFRLLWHTFTPVEKAVLDSISPLLSPTVATIYDQQLAAINKVQRYLEWTEINFYRIVRGKPNWTGIPQFPRSDEFTLAKSTYRVANTKFTSRIDCVNGHVFSFDGWATTQGPLEAAHVGTRSGAVAFREPDGCGPARLLMSDGSIETLTEEFGQ